MAGFLDQFNLNNPNQKKQETVIEEEIIVDDIEDEVEINEEEAIKEEKGTLKITSKKAIRKCDTKVSTSVALTPDAVELLAKANRLDSNMKANTVINKVLEACYNPTTKGFNKDIPTKEVEQNVNYSIQIAKKHRDSLLKEAKKRNMGIGEYLSELLLKTVDIE